METIDYKQKIKDYMNSSEVDTLYKSMLNNLFPELAESEDKRIRKAIIKIIGNIDGGFQFEKYGILKKDALDWLKKEAKGNEREIPNHAWSGEDEDNMMMIEDRLSDYLDYIREDTSLTKHQKNSMKEEVIGYVNWLKYLKGRAKHQSAWKPSDEQMKALDFYIKTYVDTEGCFGSEVLELYEQLKKIREE